MYGLRPRVPKSQPRSGAAGITWIGRPASYVNAWGRTWWSSVRPESPRWRSPWPCIGSGVGSSSNFMLRKVALMSPATAASIGTSAASGGCPGPWSGRSVAGRSRPACGTPAARSVGNPPGSIGQDLPVLRRAEPVDRFELGKPEPLPLLGDEGGRPGALPASGSSPLRDGRGGRCCPVVGVATSAFHETPRNEPSSTRLRCTRGIH